MGFINSICLPGTGIRMKKMIDKSTQEKIEFSGIIRSVQPRSNVWRYRLDNRTHSMTGYNLFLTGTAAG